jgi:hypothetical protein
MILKEFIKKLSNIKEELQNKEVTIKAENGLILPAEIKFILYDVTNPFDKSYKNVSSIIITY